MKSILWSDWTTVRGSGTTPVIQASPDWLDLAAYADVVFWIEVTEVTNPGAGSVSLAFETAPAASESLFVPVDTIDVLFATKAPKIRKVFLNATGGVPLARFLRWKLVGSVSGTWDVTFRLNVTVGEGMRNAFSPRSLPNLVLWLRADQGVTLSGTNVTAWKDLSGSGNDVAQATAGSRPVLARNVIGARPAIDFAGGKWLENTVSNLGLNTGGQPYSVLVVAKGGDGNLFALRGSIVYSGSRFQTNVTYVYNDAVNVQSLITVANTLPITQAGSGFKSCHRYNGVNTWPNIYLNGVALGVTSAAAPTTSQTMENGTAGFQVGSDPSGDTWNGFIAEVIVTKDAITDADRVRVEAYQKAFFGV